MNIVRIQTLLVTLILLIFGSAIKADNKVYQLTTVAEGFDFPWSIAFLGDSQGYLLSMRSGELRIVSEDGVVSEPVAGVPETYVASQGGFFDVELDPDFVTNQTLYLAFAHGTPESNATRVIKAKLVDNALVDTEVIFTVNRLKDTPVHYGGKLEFINDGTLLLTTGDGFQYREEAQDPTNELGVIIRMNTDGSVPQDNPFANGPVNGINASPLVYAYGFRSPQGLSYDAANNIIYMHEHGPLGGDEVNQVEAGANYGWPAVSYGINYSGAKVSPFTTLAGIHDAMHHWTPSVAPSGMTFYTGQAFVDWQGDLFVGTLVNQDVRRLEIGNGKITNEEVLFAEVGERIRDVAQGPDGNLYLLTDSSEGKLIQVSPKQ